MGKHYYYKQKNVPSIQQQTENEDRLFSNDPVIEGIKSYIERVDILIDLKEKEDMKLAKYISVHGRDIKISFYDNEKDFNFQTENTINNAVYRLKYDSSLLSGDDSEDWYYGLNELMTFIITCEGIKKWDHINQFIGVTLKKYGLEKAISYVIKNCRSFLWNRSFMENFLPNSIMSTSNKDVYIKVNRLLRDWLRKHNYKNLQTARYKYFISQNKWRYFTIDYNKKLNVLVYTTEHKSKKIILHPDKTSFWEIFPNERHWFVDDVLNNIRTHNSKSDEHFKKYLQHLVRKNISVSEMMDVLNKLDIDDGVKKRNYRIWEFRL